MSTEVAEREVWQNLDYTNLYQVTINAKKVELPVKQIVSGKVIKPSETIANPECLQYYYQFAKDENLVSVERARL